LLIRRNDYFGVVAILDGKPIGSNFIMKTDRIAAIGPVSVDPIYQGQGIGRLLMTALLTHAAQHRITELRLLQDTYNVASLSLYSSLGFEVRDAVALIHTLPALATDLTVRPMIDIDLPVIDRLSRTYYKTSRHNEVLVETKYGYQAFLKERDGRVTGYLLPGLAGHGVSETEEDAIALLGELARSVPPTFRKFLCPMRQSKLYRQAIKAHWRVEKVLTYMTLGPYEYPSGVCTPSACY
jgi:hypothetical protein